ncbi:MAG: deoxyhypusine synthase [Thermoplasmatales archaeon]|nr:deoxyhypusine synthase [Candidatus Thermoplasmatota archaeon]MCL6002633.1 deoxyhypusine synthase [Candidatus Thermoplasmatota archaeon]MDA8055912.1 deoxyhypusine synthase [Thermoplasmatales archaeon]
MKPVEDMKIRRGMRVAELLEQFASSGGFTAPKLGAAVKIIREMRENKVETFLSFTADIVSTGTRGAIVDLINLGMVNHIITTAGTVDHDLARCYKNYYRGDFMMNDGQLLKEKKYRLGNVVIPQDHYGKVIEERMTPFLEKEYQKRKKWAISDLLRDLGKGMKENSILNSAYRNGVDVFIPGYTDGSFGSQLWSFWEMNRDFAIDSLEDEHRLSEIMFNSSRGKMGAIIIGGGISKHHVIWWNQFRGGLDYAVYITTAQEFDGSLSGAQPREAVSWGKIKPRAKQVSIEGEATVILPLIVASL